MTVVKIMEVQCRIHKGSIHNSYTGPNQSNPSYLQPFIHYNIILPSTPRPVDLPNISLKARPAHKDYVKYDVPSQRIHDIVEIVNLILVN